MTVVCGVFPAGRKKEIVWGLPLSKTRKSAQLRPLTGWPSLSIATALTVTSLLVPGRPAPAVASRSSKVPTRLATLRRCLLIHRKAKRCVFPVGREDVFAVFQVLGRFNAVEPRSQRPH